MGMFDTIKIDCTKKECDGKMSMQTKRTECAMFVYDLSEMKKTSPDIINESPTGIEDISLREKLGLFSALMNPRHLLSCDKCDTTTELPEKTKQKYEHKLDDFLLSIQEGLREHG